MTVLLYIARRYRVYERIAFGIRESSLSRKMKGKSLWLPDYRVDLEAIQIKGVKSNLSGLTWNHDTNTLFAIVNRPPQIVELSTTGDVIRCIQLVGFRDTEAIEYIGNNNYIVCDERDQKIINIIIDEHTTLIDANGAPQITLGNGTAGNAGLEGLAWSQASRKLYAAKEYNPVRIYEVTGFPLVTHNELNINVSCNVDRDNRLFMNDVSGLYFNNQYQHLLVLSDESKIIIEIDIKGNPISSLSLIAGADLSRPVPQAEGIAMDDQGNLYLVSEPNLFYCFKKRM